MEGVEQLYAVPHVQVGSGVHKVDYGFVNIVGRVAANLVQLVRCAVLNKLVGDAQTDNIGRKTMVGHELENGAAKPALEYAIFYSNYFSKPFENTE